MWSGRAPDLTGISTILQIVAGEVLYLIYLCCVELIVKLYEEKASRIAVKFPYEYQAQKSYENLVRSYPGDTFLVKMELLSEKVLLTLQSDLSGKKIQYKDLDFRNDQILRLKAQADQVRDFIFVHVYPKHGSLFVAKPFRQSEFLQISAFDIFSSLYSWTVGN